MVFFVNGNKTIVAETDCSIQHKDQNTTVLPWSCRVVFSGERNGIGQ
jgi:hypothetical protein